MTCENTETMHNAFANRPYIRNISEMSLFPTYLFSITNGLYLLTKKFICTPGPRAPVINIWHVRKFNRVPQL